jgi:uncharacterized protein
MKADADRKGEWIQTYRKVRFFPLDPRPSEINIDDIAHGLSHQFRFGGHTRRGYSVAQHSVLVSQHCDPDDALWGLLHDASEAYLGDMPRPIKHLPEMAPYRHAERRIMDCVCERFKLESEMPSSVREADERALATEVRDLMYPLAEGWERWILNIQPWPEVIEPINPKAAEEMFLERFKKLVYHRFMQLG